MKAIVIEEFGGPSVFKLISIDKPLIKPGHVLIKILATSINQIDCKIRSGAVPVIAPNFPAVLHSDVVGIIEEIGSDVTEFDIGDEVYGCCGGIKGMGGALAEYILADANLLAIRPQKLTILESAALPLVSITAWEALFKKANLKSGDHILIHGGAGGVGHIAIQLAKSVNAKVSTTVTSDNDFSLVKSFGADEVINAKNESVDSYVKRLTDSRGFDIVFDTVGGANLDRSLVAASIDGSVVTTVARSTHDLTPMHNKALSLHVVFMLNPLLTGNRRSGHGKILNEISKLANEGLLKPFVDNKSFNISEAAYAHEYLESGLATGKVVLSQDLK